MAGLGRRTFQAGEVLTASNVMAYLQDQAVMNFAGTAARGSAIGTAVSEGMVSYLADSNVVQAYDGSAWNSLAYSSAVPSASTIGLVAIPIPIGSVSIAGGTASATNGIITFTSGTTSISFNSIFSTSYTRFKVLYKIQASANGNQCYYRNRAATTDYTINYFGGGVQAQYTGTVSAYGPVNNGSQGMLGTTATGANGLQGEFEIRPVAGTTTLDYRAYSMQISGVQVGGYESPSGTRTDGFTIYPSAGTFQGTVQLFAYVNG